MLATGPAGGRERVYLGVLSNKPTTARARFPKGWNMVDASDTTGSGTGTLPDATLDDGAPEAAVPLNAGQFVELAAVGPVRSTGSLGVRAHREGDNFVGEVRNSLPFDVHDVTVIIGATWAAIGDVRAGATQKWSMSATTMSTQPFITSALSQASGVFSNGIVFKGPVPVPFGGPVAQLPRAPVTGQSSHVSINDPSLVVTTDGLERGSLPDGATAVVEGWAVDQPPSVVS